MAETESKSPDGNPAERVGIPVIVLGATYGIFATVIDAWEKLNARRDLIVLASEPVTPTFRNLVFWSDWLPMACALCMFLLIFTTIAYMIPAFASFTDKQLARNTKIACWLVSALSGFGFLAFVLCFIVDAYVMLTFGK